MPEMDLGQDVTYILTPPTALRCLKMMNRVIPSQYVNRVDTRKPYTELKNIQ